MIDRRASKFLEHVVDKHGVAGLSARRYVARPGISLQADSPRRELPGGDSQTPEAA